MAKNATWKHLTQLWPRLCHFRNYSVFTAHVKSCASLFSEHSFCEKPWKLALHTYSTACFTFPCLWSPSPQRTHPVLYPINTLKSLSWWGEAEARLCLCVCVLQMHWILQHSLLEYEASSVLSRQRWHAWVIGYRRVAFLIFKERIWGCCQHCCMFLSFSCMCMVYTWLRLCTYACVRAWPCEDQKLTSDVSLVIFEAGSVTEPRTQKFR